METLDPKLDVVFKMLLLRNEPLLRAMIEAVLTLPGPITSLRILNPDLPKDQLRVRPEPPKAVRKRRARL
jgi:hypothetical protein